jgi:2-dehydro-3-deoxyphosphogluconate aldolase/(4S)-4-hydroxy-2-oxoglutarate aldolase
MFAWLSTSEARRLAFPLPLDPAGLATSLRSQPLLLVLRPPEPRLAAPFLERLQRLGWLHVEVAWSPSPGWQEQCRELIAAFPALRLGAASVCSEEALASCSAAGFPYVVSPVLEPSLVRLARAAGLTLVPGVMSPNEVHQARILGCPIVKLFPAATVGPGHWRRLRDPLGPEMPLCIAAGGLGPADVIPWLEAGVDAVALGTALDSLGERAEPALAALLERLPRPPGTATSASP